MPARELLSIDEEARIVDAIVLAEKDTSGEIRVHIEFKCSGDPLKRASKLFHSLKMDRTEQKNGVLLYIAAEDRKVAVFGDQGITEKVNDYFWQDEIETLIHFFREGKFEEGIAVVVSDIGTRLKQFFPGDRVNPNELDNSLSYKDNRGDVPAGETDLPGSTPYGDDPAGKKPAGPINTDDAPSGETEPDHD